MEYSNINFDKLSQRIVEQAYASASQVLTEEQKRKLIQDKFKRAEAHYNALKASPLWHTDA